MLELLGKILPGLLAAVVVSIYFIAKARTPTKGIVARLDQWDDRLETLVTTEVMNREREAQEHRDGLHEKLLESAKEQLGSRIDGTEKGLAATTDNLRVALDRLNQHDRLFDSTERVSKGTNERIDAAYQRTTDLVASSLW